MPESYAIQHDSYMDKHINHGHIGVIGGLIELQAKRKDGCIFPIELGVNRFNVGDALMFVGNVRDISQRKQHEAELLKYRTNLEQLVNEQYENLITAKKQAEASSLAKSEFLSNMSHELRTPMHAILNYANMGLKPANQTDVVKVEKYFTNIYTAGSRLLGLLNNLLDIAKMESGKMNFSMQEHDVRDVINHSLMELDSLVQQKGLLITTQFAAVNGIVQCDRLRLIQVIVNLLSNAIKFSPENGTIHIALHETTPDHLGISVQDSGEGIPKDELCSVFDKFVQSSKTSSSAGGTGLGLAICREIILAHKGEIWAENAHPHGAVFHVRLPR